MMRRLLRIACAIALSTSGEAFAGPPPLPLVGLFEMLAFERDGHWWLEIHLEGSGDLVGATLDPPVYAPFPLPCTVLGPSSVECERLDPPTGPGYGTLGALLSVNPPGTWLLTVNGTVTAAVEFDPVEPDGTITVTSPTGGSIVSATPEVAYTHDCTNCAALNLEIDDGEDLELEVFVIGPPLESPGAVSYDDFFAIGGPKPAELPAGDYQLLAGVVAGTQTIETLSDSSSFQYSMIAAREVVSSFTVPEPNVAWVAAFAALLLTARTRRRG